MADELAGVREHEAAHRALVSVVDAGWLRACAAAGQRCAEAAWLSRARPPANSGAALLGGPRASAEAPLESGTTGGSRGGAAPAETAGDMVRS